MTVTNEIEILQKTKESSNTYLESKRFFTECLSNQTTCKYNTWMNFNNNAETDDLEQRELVLGAAESCESERQYPNLDVDHIQKLLSRDERAGSRVQNFEITKGVQGTNKVAGIYLDFDKTQLFVGSSTWTTTAIIVQRLM